MRTFKKYLEAMMTPQDMEAQRRLQNTNVRSRSLRVGPPGQQLNWKNPPKRQQEPEVNRQREIETLKFLINKAERSELKVSEVPAVFRQYLHKIPDFLQWSAEHPDADFSHTADLYIKAFSSDSDLWKRRQ